MNNKIREIKIERTKDGDPCLWEEGGGKTHTGKSVIICNADGNEKPAMYIKRRGSRACGQHALIIVIPGDYIIQASHHNNDFITKIYKVNEIIDSAIVELEYEFKCGEWSGEPPEYLDTPIGAAEDKASRWHCRVPMYIQPMKEHVQKYPEI